MYALTKRFLASLAWVGVSLALGSGGCSEDDAATVGGRGLAEGCLINSDCNAPLVCAFRRCHTECKTSRDCELPLQCVASDRPFHVCQLDEEESHCTRNSDCALLQVCAVDLRCRDACENDRDCVLGQVCASRACAVLSELKNGKLPAPASTNLDASTGLPCMYNSDCADPLSCLRGQCTAECIVDRDCAVGFTCRQARCAPQVTGGGSGGTSGTGGAPSGLGGSNTGGLSSTGGATATGGAINTGGRGQTGDSGPGCTYNSECASGQICGNGSCVPECRVDRDCTPGDGCQAGQCVHVVPDGAPAGFGSSCALNSDCPQGLVCNVVGRCTWECSTTRDCPLSYCCSSIHTCVTGSACQSPPGPDASVDGGNGAACLSDLDCQDTSVCNGYERCVNRRCAPAAKAACDDGNPCTQDGCSETTGKCTHSPAGPTDKDFDGHQPVACGGDDCDDANGDVHGGAAELCDGIDNNCDGKIDEGVWNRGTVVTLPLGSGIVANPGGSQYPDKNIGAPAIARLSNGTFVVAATDRDDVGNFPSIQTWTLDAALKMTKGPLPTIAHPQGTPSPTSVAPSIATDGSLFVIGAYQAAVPSGCQMTWRGRLAYGTAIDALTEVSTSSGGSGQGCNPWYSVMGTSGHAIAWNGSRFLIAYSDKRDGTVRAYADSMTAAGALGGSKTVLASLAESVSGGGETFGPNRVVVAVGTTTALVAWATGTGNGSVPRYALFDQNLGALIAGPTNIPDIGGGSYPTAVAHVGRTFAIASQVGASAGISIRLVDDATGALGAVTGVDNPVGNSDARLTSIGGGFLVTYAAGTALNFGWAPEDVTKGFSTRSSVGASSVSTANVAVVDAKHAVLTWADGAVHVAPVTCGP